MEQPATFNFYHSIQQQHGPSITHKMKNFSNLLRSHAANKCRLSFLLECRSRGLTPRFIQDKSKVFDSLQQQTIHRQAHVTRLRQTFQLQFLNTEISICSDEIRQQTKTIASLRDQISNRLPSIVSEEFLSTQQLAHDRIRAARSSTHEQKLTNITLNFADASGTGFHTDFCVNLTGHPVPIEVLKLMGLGKKFALPVSKDHVPIARILAEIDQTFDVMVAPQDIKSQQRLLVHHDIMSYLRKPENFNTRDKYIRYLHKTTRKYLNENQDIIIINSDKGNKTVIMNKDEYHQKASEHLSDGNTYQLIDPSEPDQLKGMKTRNNKFVLQLHKNSHIDDEMLRRIYNENPQPPRIHFVVKTHKQDYPVRPIVSTINSPSAKLSRFLLEIMNTIPATHHFDVKNSTDLKQQIEEIRLLPGQILVSFDVTALYTNVPQEEAIQAALKLFPTATTTLPQQSFQEALNICVRENNLFLYNGHYYKQKQGLAMGSCISGILAGYTLNDVIERALKRLPKPPTFIRKYVDDIILVIDEDQVAETLRVFNSVHSSIKFTIEKEVNGSIPFLDVLLTREGERITTNWYSKPVASGRILNYLSAHPVSMKHNVALAFVKRAINLSHPKHHEENFRKTAEILAKNNYPSHIIKKVIKKARHARDTPPLTRDTETSTSGSEICYRSFPYISPLTDQIENHITAVTQNIKLGKKPLNKLGNTFSNMKEPCETPIIGGVYGLECQDCDKVYIGETQRNLKTRIHEHELDLKREKARIKRERERLLRIRLPNVTNVRTRQHQPAINEVDNIIRIQQINKNFSTAALQHQIVEGHTFDFAGFNVLERERFKPLRQLLEAIHIQMRPTATNFKMDTNNLHPTTKEIANYYRHHRHKT